MRRNLMTFRWAEHLQQHLDRLMSCVIYVSLLRQLRFVQITTIVNMFGTSWIEWDSYNINQDISAVMGLVFVSLQPKNFGLTANKVPCNVMSAFLWPLTVFDNWTDRKLIILITEQWFVSIVRNLSIMENTNFETSFPFVWKLFVKCENTHHNCHRIIKT